jgi:hypothetical protein
LSIIITSDFLRFIDVSFLLTPAPLQPDSSSKPEVFMAGEGRQIERGLRPLS